MSKKWQLVIASVFIQALIVGGIVNSYKNEFNGQYGYLSYIIIYTPAVIGGIVLSCLIFLKYRKDNPGLLITIAIVSFCFWFLIPLSFMRIKTIMKENEGRKQVESLVSQLRDANLEAASNLGLKSYSWSPDNNSITAETGNGKQHRFVLDQNVLKVRCQILQPPKRNDTIGWLRVTLDEASIYLGKNYKLFDSCTHLRKFEYGINSFENKEGPYYLFLNIYPPSNNSLYLKAIFDGNTNELNITTPYDRQAR